MHTEQRLQACAMPQFLRRRFLVKRYSQYDVIEASSSALLEVSTKLLVPLARDGIPVRIQKFIHCEPFLSLALDIRRPTNDRFATCGSSDPNERRYLRRRGKILKQRVLHRNRHRAKRASSRSIGPAYRKQSSAILFNILRCSSPVPRQCSAGCRFCLKPSRRGE